MRLSVASWSFAHCTLREAARIASAIGVDGIDLGYIHRPAIDRKRLLANPELCAEAVLGQLSLTPATLFHRFGDSREDRNLALGDNAENRQDFGAVLRFAGKARIETVMVLPGIVNSGQSRAQAIEQASRALAPLTDMASEWRVTLCVEPHVGSCIESPAQTGELLGKVPGLKLTLDPAHFIMQGYAQSEILALLPASAGLHLRPARPGAMQTRFHDGTINFHALFGALREAGFQGWLSLEALHQTYMNTMTEDVLTETLLMRDAFRSWVSAENRED
ncbi:sugar phosphate isomerase/epimerase [Chelativorans sp. AA-79]|uniref:sugar phosphate isomerase/epimerase family protein n=1 Tax=Chelativorans sp. AA-79 TaxID=3028735 RepID=UPI0023F7DF13|nr:sugar phosphate isomerase/epimerase [Chelativorans sp. AA-79]WEX12254.1 sugar phosphate isomerase/epimerase [Chelativorans sp. AA-79]